MKVVLFCGGFGMRLREYSESVPKPMIKIGHRPILWHVMKYYAHYGHRDFILCLGWKGHVIKEYFLNYDECLSNDFVLAAGGHDVHLLHRDIDDWRITFVDTGSAACIGQRLRAVQPHLGGESTFLANYADGLTDLPLPELIDFHRQQDAIATFLSVKPKQSFHSVVADQRGRVRQLEAISQADVWMNGGYFVLDAQIFDYLREGEELVETPFRRLIARQRLSTLRYDGFWCCMDTYKEMQTLEDMYTRGESPWEVWKQGGALACPPWSAPQLAVPAALT
jgi:glucose-1-phosphate cytidylyltransferase